MKELIEKHMKFSISIIMILALTIFLAFNVYQPQPHYTYIVEINKLYYTNTKPRIYDSGRCIEINSFDKQLLNFCDVEFLIREN